MNNDATVGYIMKDADRLRKPMQQVVNFILEHMDGNSEVKLIIFDVANYYYKYYPAEVF